MTVLLDAHMGLLGAYLLAGFLILVVGIIVVAVCLTIIIKTVKARKKWYLEHPEAEDAGKDEAKADVDSTEKLQ